MRAVFSFAGLLAIGVALAAARPGSEQELIQALNGQQVRWLLPDGGPSGVFTVSDGGAANNMGCMPILGGTYPGGVPASPKVLVFVPLQPLNVCMQQNVFTPAPGQWDGGCNTNPASINYGVPVPVGVPQYITPDSTMRQLCFVGDGGSLAVPVFSTE